MMHAKTARPRSWPGATPSWRAGSRAAVRSPTAWRKPASACSPSCATRPSSGARLGPRTPSNVCTRSSSAGSRPSACCPVPRPPPCSSGRSSPRVRSPCAGSMAGQPSTVHPSTLTSPPDQPPCPRSRAAQFPPTSRHYRVHVPDPERPIVTSRDQERPGPPGRRQWADRGGASGPRWTTPAG